MEHVFLGWLAALDWSTRLDHVVYHALMKRYTLYTHSSQIPPINTHSSFTNSYSISHYHLIVYKNVYDVNVPPLTFRTKILFLFLSRDSINGQRAMSHFVNLYLL